MRAWGLTGLVLLCGLAACEPPAATGGSLGQLRVTAHLVVPVSEEELSLPSDHVRIPNEFELFLLGNTDGAGAPGMVQAQGFDGDFGYVVE